MAVLFLSKNSSKMHSRSVKMGIFLANPDAPSCCTATDCLVKIGPDDNCVDIKLCNHERDMQEIIH